MVTWCAKDWENSLVGSSYIVLYDDEAQNNNTVTNTQTLNDMHSSWFPQTKSQKAQNEEYL
jgi:hypothetical protein